MSLVRAALVAGWSLLLVPASLAGDIEPQEPVTKFTGARPFGDVGDEERIIEHQLDTTESRVLRHSERPLEQQQLQRDLGATEQRLHTFKTENPNAAATPLFERQLDRLNRPARVRKSGPPSLLDRN